MIKYSLIIIVSAVVIISSLQIYSAFYASTKIETTFDGVVNNLSSASVTEIKQRLPSLLALQQLDINDLPEDFVGNLVVRKLDGKLQIGSEYQIVIWMLGKPQMMTFDDDAESEQEVSLIERMRQKARLDLDFKPYAETP